MIRLLKIELAKLWPANYFRILLALWLVAFITIPFASSSFLDWMANNKMMSQNPMFNPSHWPIFDFADLWQNLAYIYKMISIFMSFIIIISVTNEFDYKTVRQNVIDGFSKTEFWLSKISLIICFSVLSAVLLFILGLIIGYSMFPIFEMKLLFTNISFLFAYFFQVFYLLMFAFVLSILIKRAGIVIAIMVFWIYIIEPMLSAIIGSRLVDWPMVSESLPVEAGWNLIQFPFRKYLLMKTQDFISLQDIAIAGAWFVFFFWSSYMLLTKRDL